MAIPTDKFVAILIDGDGNRVGTPEYFATKKEAITGGGEMLRKAAIGPECYIFEVGIRVTAKTTFNYEELADRIKTVSR